MTVSMGQGGISQAITVSAIPPGAFEFLSACLHQHGGSARASDLRNNAMTEIQFRYPDDPTEFSASRTMVAEWCEANFPGVPVREVTQGRHSASAAPVR